MRLTQLSMIALMLAACSIASAQEQYPSDPVPSASSPYITNQFMQLDNISPTHCHTGVDIWTTGGVQVICPIQSGSDCQVINNPSGGTSVLLVARQRQQGDLAIFQALHINPAAGVRQGTWLHQNDPLGTVTATDQHLHAEVFLTPTLVNGMTLDPYLVHPQIYAFSQVHRWNDDTVIPTVDATVVHPGVSGIPTVFEVRAHDQANSNTSFFNGIYEIRLYVDDNLVDDIHFDRMQGRYGQYPFDPSDYYYCTTCYPSGTNNPNVLTYKLLWNTVVGSHIWRLDVFDWKGNLLHGDPVNGLPGHAAPAVSMGGTIENGRVHLKWKIAASDLREAGITDFNLWTSESKTGQYQQVNTAPIEAKADQEDYALTIDPPRGPATAWYRLTGNNSVGSTLILAESSVEVPALSNGLTAFPNPVPGNSTIRLSLARDDVGEVAIFDLSGRRVRALHQGAMKAGVTTLSWDGRDDDDRPLSSGLYVLRVRTRSGATLPERKLALVRKGQ